MISENAVLAFLLAGFGLFFIVKGEVPIIKNRVVQGFYAQILGGIMLLAAPLHLLYGDPVCLGTFILVIIIGLITSEKKS